MTNFIGTYDCKADVKGRVMIPVTLKNQMAPVLNKGFVIKRSVFQPCLELYPMDEWNLLMQKMNKKNRFKKKNNDFIRRFSAGVKPIEIDGTGRLLIPKNLMSVAGITKEVVLSSAINIIEIWDKDSYEKVLEETAENFAELAEEVMGDDGDELS
ncbi:division/cell wall cluster transcriptional repressor MraZ [Poritiphilus flavus]|uniref:Transcriptional regulator MraZ n=1 Tax=Poritiphilus flavus TaxID=2697053 RepID=A0A6L9EGW0_9FLAO|nr:division/cell wall cluster transcriptional repressor MraZ [Poritiphilus flavus]NAS14017.1 division/cell wall cluster transcriptional repressor MraZ [Poritiphilus flavus]